ncbi:MAG: hypothetical protein LAT77_11095 [Aliidiomarina sp.]|uniref:hypothetical protein n=1 Tax=Aliidiomarina sp. TaxID=1872439 RepID=UPI0025C184CB|nr:hypothetical protein [Aliidiomarina sp.]MCH8502441.1 hypothetical protein [Aliidiomarina sp.]
MSYQAIGLFVHTIFDKKLPAQMLSGYAFTNSAFILENAGLIKYKQKYQNLYKDVVFGRFSLIEHDGRKVFIRTDPSGQDTLFVFDDGKHWGISNSLLLLTQTLHLHGVKTEFAPESLDAFFVGGGGILGGQIVSNKTAIEHCRLLSPNQYVELNYENKTPTLTVQVLQKPKRSESYEHFLKSFGESWLQRVKAFAAVQRSLSISLSGGVDSRVSKALLHASNVDYQCYSHADSPDDLKVAKQLCFESGALLTSNRSELQPRVNKKSHKFALKDSIRLGLYASAGVYNRFAPVRSFNLHRRINFVGGSLIGPVTMSFDTRKRLEAIELRYGAQGIHVAEEIAAGIKGLGLEVDDPFAMFHHYANFRSRIHYGAAWRTASQTIEVHPCMDSVLLELPELVSKEYIMGNGVPRDIIHMLAPSLGAVEYDAPGKIQSPERTSAYPSLAPKDDLELFFDVDEIEPKSTDLSIAFPSKPGGSREQEKYLRSLFPELESFALEIGFNDSVIAKAKAEIEQGKRLMAYGNIINLYALSHGIDKVLPLID